MRMQENTRELDDDKTWTYVCLVIDSRDWVKPAITIRASNQQPTQIKDWSIAVKKQAHLHATFTEQRVTENRLQRIQNLGPIKSFLLIIYVGKW